MKHFRVWILYVTLGCLLTFTFAEEKVEKGLYNSNDNVTVFNGDNLLPTLANSPTIWFIEYYSSWCGHCQEFAPVFKALAKDVAEWHLLVNIGAINCPSRENSRTCRSMSILDYPTLRFYSALSNSSGETYQGEQEIKEMRNGMVDYVTNHIDEVKWNHNSPKPILRPSGFEEVMKLLFPTADQHAVLYTAVVFEEEKSYLGKEVILDTSSCTNLVVRRVNVDGKDGERIATKMRVDLTQLPHVLVIHRNGTLTDVDVKLKTRYFYTYQLTKLEGVGEPIAKLEDSPFSRNLSDSYNNLQHVTVDFKTVRKDQVYLADIESAINYALTMEVTTAKVLEGRKLQGLKTFIAAFAKLGDHMPGRPATIRFMAELNKWLQPQQSVSYRKWLRKVKDEKIGSHLPPTNRLWVGCQPSKPSLRRYPCSLWTLFHTMSVAAYNADVQDKSLIPSAMAAYITNFFGCRDCRINFQKEIKQLPYKDNGKPYDAVLWLWRVHNSVNERLHSNSSTEDPEFPKLQFPSTELCGSCKKSQGSWEESEVGKFLVARYSRENISFDYLNITTAELNDNVHESRSGTKSSKNKKGGSKAKSSVWEKRLENAKTHETDDDVMSFHPRGLGSNALGRREVGSVAASFRLQLGFSQLDVNLCVMMWCISIVGSLLLFWAYKWRRTVFYRRKNIKHVL